MTPAQRRFITKSLGVAGWLALGLYAAGIVAGYTVREGARAAFENALIAAVMFSPALGVGLLALWASRFVRLGGEGEN